MIARCALLALLAACSGDRREPSPSPAPVRVAIAIDAAPPDASPDAAVDPIVALRAQGFDRAADTIAKRVAQRAAKMKLTDEQARTAAR
ncbi:MAG TPA: hypothetical protein VIV11_07620, partial [Kofleriaceae bacterium]